MSTTRTGATLILAIFTLSLAAPAAQPAVATGGSARTGVLESGTRSARPTVQIPDLVLPSTAELPGATVYAETAEQVELVEAALERFADAGLALPDVTTHMHSDRSKCGGSSGEPAGGYYTVKGDEHIVHICSPDVLDHELGHAWDRANLDDATRETILLQRGLDSWSHNDWIQAGGEHLASTIAWALGGGYPHSIGYFTLEGLDTTYQLATGHRAPFMIEHGL